MMEYPGEQKPDYRSPTQFGGSMDEGDSNDSALSLLDEKREKHLIRKIDLHIIPFVVLLYLFSFLDRGMSSHTSHLCLQSMTIRMVSTLANKP